MPSIASVTIDARLDFSSLNRDFNQLQSEATKSGAKVGKSFGDSLESSVKAQGGRLTSVMSGVFAGIGMGLVNAAGQGIAALGGLGQKMLSVGADAEKSRVAFTTFLGSAQKADSVLKEITRFAAETPFELPEVEKAARQLLAFGFTADQLKPTLTAVGNIAAGTGVNFGELADIIGKAKTQGRLYAEDINQLTGRGIPIIAELAKQYGVTEGQVKKLVESGKVGFNDLNKALVSMSSEGGKFNNLMAKLADTTGGKFTNLSDRITQSFISIFKNIQPAINAALDLAAAFFDGFKVDFRDINSLAKDFANWLIQHKDEARELGQIIGGVVSTSLRTINNLAKDFSAFLRENPAILQTIGGLVRGIGEGYKVWGQALNAAFNLAKEIANVFAKMIGFIDTAVKKTEELTRSFQDWVKASSQNIFGGGGGGGKASSSALFPVAGGTGMSNVVGGGGSFGARRNYGAHSGQDYAFSQGTQVQAPITGKIKTVASDKGEFKVVLEGMVGRDRMQFDLVHLATTNVRQGMTVSQGQVLGTVGGEKGSWGSTGTHLHAGVRRNGQILDPKQYFGGGQGGEEVDPSLIPGYVAPNKSKPDYSRLTSLLQEREANRVMQNLDYANRRSNFSNLIQERKFQGIDRASDQYQWMDEYGKRTERLMEIVEASKNKASELKTEILDGVGGAFKTAFGDLISGTKSLSEVALDLLGNLASKLLDLGLNSIFGSFGGAGGLLGGLFGGGRKVPSYAVGTPYVPSNQLAFLHQGEAVIPAKHNRENNTSPINVTVNNAPGEGAMDNKQADKIAQQVRRTVEAEILRQRKPGGLL